MVRVPGPLGKVAVVVIVLALTAGLLLVFRTVESQRKLLVLHSKTRQ